MVGNQPGVRASVRDHFTDEVERDRLLGLGSQVIAGVSSDLVVRWIGSALCEEG